MATELRATDNSHIFEAMAGYYVDEFGDVYPYNFVVSDETDNIFDGADTFEEAEKLLNNYCRWLNGAAA